jgi:hypothetical protein
VCTVRPGGITVLDTCPSEAVFDAFSTGPDFVASYTAAGLPEPVIRKLGEVHRACLRREV